MEHMSRGKERVITGKLVSFQAKKDQTLQLAQFSRDWTWGMQNTVKSYKKQVALSDRKQVSSFVLKTSQGKKEDGIPVSWLESKFRFFNFANWPNSAGMGPGG
jgi:hypothetical protein